MAQVEEEPLFIEMPELGETDLVQAQTTLVAKHNVTLEQDRLRRSINYVSYTMDH